MTRCFPSLGALWFVALSMAGGPATAAAPECDLPYRACTSACGLLGPFSQNCRSGCGQQLMRCRAGPQRAPAPAESAATPARAVTPEATAAVPYVQPAELTYLGPIRFDGEAPGRYQAGDDATPLQRQGSMAPMGTAAGGSSPQPVARSVLLADYTNPDGMGRGRLDKALAAALAQEHAALHAAGFRGLTCTYAPRARDNGWTFVSFWAGPRAVLSTQLVELLKKLPTVDVSLAQCPATLGEAREVAAGRIKPVDAAALEMAQADLKAKTGMRFVPQLPGTNTAADPLPLGNSTVLLATNMFGQDNSHTSTEGWQQNAAAPVNATVLRLHKEAQAVLLCDYSGADIEIEGAAPDDVNAYSPAGQAVMKFANNTPVRFWHRSKPADVSVDFFTQAQVWGRPIVDIAVERCPANYSQALALANGSPTAPDSPAGPAPPNDKADDALRATLQRELAALSRARDTLGPTAYREVVTSTIKPALVPFARSALVRLEQIPAGPAGRARFDAWDRDFGGPVLDAVRTPYSVVRRQAFRTQLQGASLADLKMRPEQAQQDKAAWLRAAAAQLYARRIYRAFVTAYEQRLEGQPLLEPAFESRARAGLSRAAGQRQSEGPALAPAQARRIVIFGTPAQIAAARFGLAAGEALSSANELRRQHTELDARLSQSRQAFWACYQSRCADAAKPFLDYSVALRDKDVHFLFKPVVLEAAERATGGAAQRQGMLNTLLSMLGAGGVDDGIVLGCESQADAFKTSLRAEMAKVSGGVFNGAEVTRLFEQAAQGETYGTYQACRDRHEYMYRPR